MMLKNLAASTKLFSTLNQISQFHFIQLTTNTSEKKKIRKVRNYIEFSGNNDQEEIHSMHLHKQSDRLENIIGYPSMQREVD